VQEIKANHSMQIEPVKVCIPVEQAGDSDVLKILEAIMEHDQWSNALKLPFEQIWPLTTLKRV
jgi:hypothetical protein